MGFRLPPNRQVRRSKIIAAAALSLAVVFLFPVAAAAQSDQPTLVASATDPQPDPQPVAQTDAKSKSQTASAKAPTSQPAKKKIGPLEISGSWRFRSESWDWFQAATGNSNYTFPHSLLRVAIGQTGDRFDWLAEMGQVFILALPNNAVLPAPQGQLGAGATYYVSNGNTENNAMVFLKQAFVRFKHVGDGQVRLGRFEYFDGAELVPKDPSLATLINTRIAQRLVGNFAFSAVQRSFDGGQFTYDVSGTRFTFAGARATQGVYQADANLEIPVDFFYGSATVPVKTGDSEGQIRFFGLGYLDHRTAVLKTDNRPSAARAADHQEIQIGTYGANYLHVFSTPSAGKFDFIVWGALQSGSWGELTHRASAFVTEAGWQPPAKTLKPWLRGGYSYGSGDGNNSDGVHQTFFQVLPTPRIYARYPFYNMMNNEDAYGMLTLRPHSKLSIRTDFHALRLTNANDLWYLGGGTYQNGSFGYTGRPSNGHRSLASLWDVSGDIQVSRDFSVTAYYAHAWGKSVVAAIYPKDRHSNYFYLETNLRF